MHLISITDRYFCPCREPRSSLRTALFQWDVRFAPSFSNLHPMPSDPLHVSSNKPTSSVLQRVTCRRRLPKSTIMGNYICSFSNFLLSFRVKNKTLLKASTVGSPTIQFYLLLSRLSNLTPPHAMNVTAPACVIKMSLWILSYSETQRRYTLGI